MFLYPAGSFGLALLLLRASAAAALVGALVPRNAPSGLADLAFLLSVALIAGRLTRPVAFGCTAIALLAMRSAASPVEVLDGAMAVTSTALIIMGPGAYSLDGRLFGRRILKIPVFDAEPPNG